MTGTLELVIPLGARLGHPRWRKALAEAGVDPDTAEDVVRRVGDSYVAWQENSFPGLLGNVGLKSDDEEWYLGARGIRFWRHPGANLSKKPGRWIVCAELVETTRLYGRGIAAIEPQWIVQIAGHLLKTQLLEPHWEKKAAEVVALERATLYGIVVYSNRRVNFARVDAAGARELFIRHALVEGREVVGCRGVGTGVVALSCGLRPASSRGAHDGIDTAVSAGPNHLSSQVSVDAEQ